MATCDSSPTSFYVCYNSTRPSGSCQEANLRIRTQIGNLGSTRSSIGFEVRDNGRTLIDSGGPFFINPNGYVDTNHTVPPRNPDGTWPDYGVRYCGGLTLNTSCVDETDVNPGNNQGSVSQASIGLCQNPTPTPTHVPTSTPAAQLSHQIGVLILKYFPTVPCNQLNPALKISLDKTKAVSNVPDSTPKYAFDGEREAGGRWHSDPNTYQDYNYLQIELNNAETIRGINLIYFYVDFPDKYELLASETGSFNGEQTTIVSYDQSLNCQYHESTSMRMQSCFFTPTTAKYLRFGFRREDTGNRQTNLYEMEIFKDVLEKRCFDKNTAGTDAFKSNPEMSDPLSEVKTKADEITNVLRTSVVNGSRYHGYKNPGAIPSLNFTFYNQKDYYEPIPKRTTGFFRQFADQFAYLGRENICDLVDNRGVKEVWTVMYHSPTMVPKESNHVMGRNINSYWNYSNHGEASNDTYKENDLPICENSYTVYEFNISTGADNAVHNYLHQIENIMQYVSYDMFWNKFGGKKFHDEPGNWICGNSHFPPQVPHSDYYYHSPATVNTSCENWKPDGTGTAGLISCQNWSCDQRDAAEKFYIWWMQNLPGKDNGLVYQGRLMLNWWDYMGDFDNTVRFAEKSFFYPAGTTPTPADCPNGDLGNLNCDALGKIDSSDFELLLSLWAPYGPVPTPPPGYHSANLYPDNVIDEKDLSVLMNNWVE